MNIDTDKLFLSCLQAILFFVVLGLVYAIAGIAGCSPMNFLIGFVVFSVVVLLLYKLID